MKNKIKLTNLPKAVTRQETTTNVAVTENQYWDIITNKLNDTEIIAKFILDKKSMRGVCGYISAFPGKTNIVIEKLTQLKNAGILYWNMLDKFTTTTVDVLVMK